MSASQNIRAGILRHRALSIRVVGAGLSMILLSALGFGAHALLRPARGSGWAGLSLTNVAQAQEGEIEKVTVVLQAEGFNPASVTRAAGSFLLAIDNRSGVPGLSLQLRRDGHGKVLEYIVPAGAGDFSQEIQLEPGEYTLREVNHPAWLFHITAQ